MKTSKVIQAWKSVLSGRRPSLAIEVTRECPLRCPGCYAYEEGHVGGLNLRQLQDKRGDELVAGVLALVDEHRPLHLSLVGGDPLVRQREVTRLLPQLDARGRRLSRLKFSEQSMAKERNAQHKNQLGRI